MKSIKYLIDRYAYFVSHNASKILVLVIIFSLIAIIGASKVSTESTSSMDALPDDIEVVQAFDLIEDKFGSTDSVMIVVEVNPEYKDSEEPRDIRDPEIVEYLYLLAELAEGVEYVDSTASPGTILKSINNNYLPKSKNEIIELSRGNSLFNRYISEDNSIALVRIELIEGYHDKQLYKDLQEVVMSIPKPAGVKTDVAGDIIADAIVSEAIGKDIGKTSQFSFISILLILLLLSGSIRYGIIPLSTIIIGIAWTMGYLGFMGTNLTTYTSGVISMIMGIGIDFGIQTTTRFREELKNKIPEDAMHVTLNHVFTPMATTTLAALVGFKAMAMGQLTILEELGVMMSYGVFSCFIAAITIIPVLLILAEKYHYKIKETISKKEINYYNQNNNSNDKNLEYRQRYIKQNLKVRSHFRRNKK